MFCCRTTGIQSKTLQKCPRTKKNVFFPTLPCKNNFQILFLIGTHHLLRFQLVLFPVDFDCMYKKRGLFLSAQLIVLESGMKKSNNIYFWTVQWWKLCISSNTQPERRILKGLYWGCTKMKWSIEFMAQGLYKIRST